MTEKSEDQVVYLCTECKLVNCRVCTEEQAYIPQQYLFVAEAETDYFQKELEKVRSDLGVAMEALEKIAKLYETHDLDWEKHIYITAKEALGKIGIEPKPDPYGLIWINGAGATEHLNQFLHDGRMKIVLSDSDKELIKDFEPPQATSELDVLEQWLEKEIIEYTSRSEFLSQHGIGELTSLKKVLFKINELKKEKHE